MEKKIPIYFNFAGHGIHLVPDTLEHRSKRHLEMERRTRIMQEVPLPSILIRSEQVFETPERILP
jgi:hypothetical protein